MISKHLLEISHTNKFQQRINKTSTRLLKQQGRNIGKKYISWKVRSKAMAQIGPYDWTRDERKSERQQFRLLQHLSKLQYFKCQWQPHFYKMMLWFKLFNLTFLFLNGNFTYFSLLWPIILLNFCNFPSSVSI